MKLRKSSNKDIEQNNEATINEVDPETKVSFSKFQTKKTKDTEDIEISQEEFLKQRATIESFESSFTEGSVVFERFPEKNKIKENKIKEIDKKVNGMNFYDLLNQVQNIISNKYPDIFKNKETVQSELKLCIKQILLSNKKTYFVRGMSTNELILKLYNEMAEYSILTPFLTEWKEYIEEINVNAWNDIAIIDRKGKTRKLLETFNSPLHAQDVAKKILSSSGTVIDKSVPLAQSQLGNDIRIACLIDPLVDEEVGISMSIRVLHQQTLDEKSMIDSEFCTQEEMDFLKMALNHGVSMLIAGSTGSGKTTLMNILLETIPNNNRVYTIETGARELNLVKRSSDTGRITNNIVHTKARPSTSEINDITQEKLVEYALRFDPKIICVGEIRNVEAYNAVEANLTGHTGIASVHSGPGRESHIRTGLLCMKKQKIDYDIAVRQAAEAFPLVVFVSKLRDGSRKIMDISECYYDNEGKAHYNRLYGFDVESNIENEDGTYKTIGEHKKINIISEELKNKLIQYGVEKVTLEKFITTKKK